MWRLVFLYWLAPAGAVFFCGPFSFGTLLFLGLWGIELLCRWLSDVQNEEIRKIAVGIDDEHTTALKRVTKECHAAKLRSKLADPDRVAHLKATHDMYRWQKNEEIRMLRAQIKKAQGEKRS